MDDILIGQETITIIRKTLGANDDFGNPTYTSEEIEVDQCLVEIGGSSIAQTLFRDLATVDVVVYIPYGTLIEDNDSFELRGKAYRMASEPQEWIPFEDSIISPRVIVGLERFNG